MSKTLTLLLLLLFALSCNKEEMQKAAVINAMTTGQWKVVKYLDGTTDLTQGFAPYKFQFNTNATVQAINGSTTEATGSWSADATNKTITSQFPTANNTIQLLNGTWLITNNSWDFVEASQTVGVAQKTLRLEKI